jgi:XRE family transcriptional regulator, regulator of sulfur utilization
MNIGQGLKEVRLKKGLRQGNFAKQIGISQTFISQIENGSRNPSLDLLQKIASFYQLPLAVLLWFSVDEADIQEGKQRAFKLMKPSIDAMIESVL